MPAYKTINLGIGSTTSLMWSYGNRNIGVASIEAYGDPSNIASTSYSDNTASQVSYEWGKTSSGTIRRIPIWLYAGYRSLIPKRPKVVEAILHQHVATPAVGGTGTVANTWPAAGVTFSIYEFNSTLNVTTAATAQTYDGTSPWSGSGYGPLPGSDYAATPIASASISTAQATAGLTTPFFIDLDITTAFDAAARADRTLRMLAVPSFTPIGFGNGTLVGLRLTHDNSAASATHSYIELKYHEAVSVYNAGTGSGRPVDVTSELNAAGASQGERIYLTASQGTTSSYGKYYVKNNHTTGQAKRVVVELGRAQANPVNNAGSVSGNVLKRVDVFNLSGSTELTVTGTLRVAPKASDVTRYNVYFTPQGSSEVALAEYGTGTTDLTFTADHTLSYNAKKLVTIPTLGWFQSDKTTATTSGFSASDVWTVALQGDLWLSTYSASTTDLVYLAPEDAGSPDTPDTSKRRKIGTARTEQSWLAPADYTISLTARTHLRVRSTTGFVAGQYVTVFDKDGANAVTTTIETVYANNDATYPAHLRLSTQLTLANYDAQSCVTGGIYAGNLSAANETRLDGAIAGGVSVLDVTAALSPAPANGDTIVVLDLDDGDSEELTVASVAGYAITLDDPTTLGFSDGSLVAYRETVSNEPFYVALESGIATAEGQYAGLLRVREVALA